MSLPKSYKNLKELAAKSLFQLHYMWVWCCTENRHPGRPHVDAPLTDRCTWVAPRLQPVAKRNGRTLGLSTHVALGFKSLLAVAIMPAFTNAGIGGCSGIKRLEASGDGEAGGTGGGGGGTLGTALGGAGGGGGDVLAFACGGGGSALGLAVSVTPPTFTKGPDDGVRARFVLTALATATGTEEL